MLATLRKHDVQHHWSVFGQKYHSSKLKSDAGNRDSTVKVMLMLEFSCLPKLL